MQPLKRIVVNHETKTIRCPICGSTNLVRDCTGWINLTYGVGYCNIDGTDMELDASAPRCDECDTLLDWPTESEDE